MNTLWFFADKPSPNCYSELLSGAFSVTEEAAAHTRSITILDDFDWHIWQAGGLLVQEDARLLLLRADASTVVFQGPAPQFVSDVESPEARGYLSPLIGYRALQSVFACEYSESTWAVRNLEDDKLVCRIREVWLQQNAETPECSGYVTLEALRGYHEEYAHICDKLQQYLNTEPGNETVGLRGLLRHLDLEQRIPKPVTADLAFNLCSEDAVRLMLNALLLDAQRHVEGLCADLDTEYLHDFRVQIRKARSLVQLLKKSLGSEQQQQLKLGLADIARPTGALRDLDVFLLEQARYRNLLPESQHAGFDLLLRNVKKARSQAFKTVSHYLTEGNYSRDFDAALALVEQPSQYETPEAKCAIGEQVAMLINKRYRKICKMGLAIDDNTPDEAVHSLRIECKKLRYLLTLFGSLYNTKPLKKIIKRMKVLQSVLGNFNDFAVQQRFLTEQASRSRSQNLIMAVSGLVAVLHQKQLEVRAHVCDGLSEFAAPETASLIQQLLAREGE